MNAAVPENGNVRFTISQLHLPCEDEVRGWECCQYQLSIPMENGKSLG